MTAEEQREARRAYFETRVDMSQKEIDALRAWIFMTDVNCGDCDERHPWPCYSFVN